VLSILKAGIVEPMRVVDGRGTAGLPQAVHRGHRSRAPHLVYQQDWGVGPQVLVEGVERALVLAPGFALMEKPAQVLEHHG
jgi:hypothetical protein